MLEPLKGFCPLRPRVLTDTNGHREESPVKVSAKDSWGCPGILKEPTLPWCLCSDRQDHLPERWLALVPIRGQVQGSWPTQAQYLSGTRQKTKVSWAQPHSSPGWSLFHGAALAKEAHHEESRCSSILTSQPLRAWGTPFPDCSDSLDPSGCLLMVYPRARLPCRRAGTHQDCQHRGPHGDILV